MTNYREEGQVRIGDRMREADQEGPSGHLRNALQIGLGWRALLEGDDESQWQPEGNGHDITDALASMLWRATMAELVYWRDTPGRLLQLTSSPAIADKLSLARSEALYCLKTWRTYAARPQGPKRSHVLGNLSAVTRRLSDALQEVESVRRS